MPADLRVPMTRAAFGVLGAGDEYPLAAVYSAVIDSNVLLRGAAEAAGSWGHPSFRACLTPGLKAWLDLQTFDGQVNNGGLTQFLWNCPDMVEDVATATRLIGDNELAAAYQKALDQIADRIGPWDQLRATAYADPDAPDWEPFRQSYDLLDLGWFDRLYYDAWGNKSLWSRERVVKREGLGKRLYRRLEVWVRAHPDEFIRPPDEGTS